MHRPISPLTTVLASSLTVTGFGILLSQTGLTSSEFVVWTTVLAFFILALVFTIRTAIRCPSKLTFSYIFVLTTAGSWVSYTVTTLGSTSLSATYTNTDTILITFFQSVLGCLVALQVFNRINGYNQAHRLPHWLPVLLGRVQALPWSVILVTLGIYLILMIYRFSLGLVMSGTGGIMAEVSMLQSTILQLSEQISVIVTLLGYMLLLLDVDQRRRLFGIGILLLQFVLIFLMHGRRGMFGFVLLGGLLWTIARGLNFKRLLIMVGIMVLVVAVAWPAFLLLRHTAQQEGIHSAAVTERTAILAQAGTSTFREFSIQNAYSREYTENLENRFSFLGWSVMIQERVSDGWEVRGGQVFFISLLELIPRFLWPGKFDYLGHIQIEQKIQEWFRMPMGDGASTLLGYAIADGGWIGVILYFAFFGFTLGLVAHFICTRYFTLTRLWAVGVMFSLCYSIEAGLSEQIGVLRLLASVLLVEWLLRQITIRPKSLPDTRMLVVANRPFKKT